MGPGTADLGFRFGLHSGPVTGGVLRGDRARFQLFGDTVNTAARIESSGLKGKIHISEATADILTASGKGHWIVKRPEMIVAKGKGEMQTYWADPQTADALSTTTGHSEATHAGAVGNFDEDYTRLVDWGAEKYKGLVQQIVSGKTKSPKETSSKSLVGKKQIEAHSGADGECYVLDEVNDIIEFPTGVSKSKNPRLSVALDQAVIDQIQDFLETIASMHRKHPFHNFHHASHVAMSVVKRTYKCSFANCHIFISSIYVHHECLGATILKIYSFSTFGFIFLNSAQSSQRYGTGSSFDRRQPSRLRSANTACVHLFGIHS